MEFSFLSKTAVPLLRKSLDAYSRRHTAIAENIANVETEGFRPAEVRFEDELRRALSPNRPKGLRSSDRHLQVGGQDVESVMPKLQELDKRVDVEQEMADLAQTQVRFELASRKLRGSYEVIKMSIRGRNG